MNHPPRTNESETASRDAVLRRMLRTPPKPHKPKGKKRKSPKRRKARGHEKLR